MDPTYDEKSFFHIAGSAESSSEHPIAAAVIRKASEVTPKVAQATEFEAIPGQGKQYCSFLMGKRIAQFH